MLLDLIDLERLRRGIIYGLFLIFCLFLQTIVLSKIIILDIKLLLIPIAVCAIGFFESGVWGAVFGIFIGLSTDMSMDSGFFIFTFLLPLIGFFTGCGTMFFVERKFMNFFFMAFVAELVMTLGQMVVVSTSVPTNILSLGLVGGLQCFLSLILIPPTYIMVKFLAKMKLVR